MPSRPLLVTHEYENLLLGSARAGDSGRQYTRPGHASHPQLKLISVMRLLLIIYVDAAASGYRACPVLCVVFERTRFSKCSTKLLGVRCALLRNWVSF